MRTNFIPTWLFLYSVILPGAIASTASAGFYLTTGITGAQVGCDINHTQHWTYTVTQDIADVQGALLTMKRGPSTNASITFSIFEGFYADYGIATNLLSSTLTPTAFTPIYACGIFCKSHYACDWENLHSCTRLICPRCTKSGLLHKGWKPFTK